ncbi:RNA-directed DNA polymerase, eukaryota, reverse transcriptase zinc-binding domain protein [Tanacetum coccineum]
MEDDYADGCYGLIVLTGINVHLDLFWSTDAYGSYGTLILGTHYCGQRDGYGSLMQGCYECFIIRFNNLVVLHGSLAMPANICVCYLDESYRVVSWFVSMEVSREGYLEVLGNNMCLRAGLTPLSKVKDIIYNGSWNWPVVLIEKYPFLATCSVPIVNGSPDAIGLPFGFGSARLGSYDCIASIARSVFMFHDALGAIPINNPATFETLDNAFSWSCKALGIGVLFLFTGVKLNSSSLILVIDCIMSSIRLKLMSCKFKRSKDGETMARKLKGRCVWNLTVTKNTAWCWKSIMKLRDKIRDFVGIRVGNGRDCFIWFDKWHSNGPLSKIITHNLLSSYDIDVTDKLVDWIDNGKWTWPNEWFRRFNDVINIPVPILNELNDKAIWFNKKYEVMDFSVKEACNVLRTDMPSVMWYKHVWYTQCIPRHAFILWLAFKGRLKTQDRVKIMAKLDDVSNIWAEVISGVCIKKPSNSIWSVIQRLVLGASVYFIWQERNVRLFDSKNRSVDVVLNIIVNTVRLKLLSLNLKWSRDVGTAAKVWHLPNLGLKGNNLFVDNMVIDDRSA